MDLKKYSIDDILKLNKPTDEFLVDLKANTYKIRFQKFKIRDAKNDCVFFEVEKDPNEIDMEDDLEELEKMQDWDEKEYRTIRYNFGPEFFDLKEIGTSLTFKVGERAMKNFRMIERHYFKDTLIQSFDFEFPFCMPGSTNDWESIYEIPSISPEMKQEMIANPYATKSDSFYFVDGVLIMHNKAEYSYLNQEQDQDEEEYQQPSHNNLL